MWDALGLLETLIMIKNWGKCDLELEVPYEFPFRKAYLFIL
jgi:hypothetical protein